MEKSETALGEQEYAIIGAIARFFFTDATLSRICKDICLLLASRLDAMAAEIALYDGAAGGITHFKSAGSQEDQRYNLKVHIQDSIYKEVIETQQAITDKKKIDARCWSDSWLGSLEPAAILLVPMRMQERAIGALGIAFAGKPKDMLKLAATAHILADYIAQEVLRRQAERDLQKKEVFFRTMVDYQTEFVCRMSPDTTFRFVNETYLRYLEKFQEEVIGARLIDFVEEADRAAFAVQVQALHAGAQVVAVEHRWMRPAGDMRWHRWTLRMLLDANGLPLEMLGVGRDCTEEKKIQDALKVREAQYRAVVEDQTELIARFQPDGTMIFANEAFCNYFAMQSQGIIGSRFIPQVLPEDNERIGALMKNLTAENPSCMIEFRLCQSDNVWRWTQWSFLAIIDEQDAITEYQAVGRDIHEIRQLQDLLQKNQAMLQAMFDGMTEPIFMLDENCLVKMANKATLSYYNAAAAADCLNRPCYEAFMGQNQICPACAITGKLNLDAATTFERSGKPGPGSYEQVNVYPLRLSGIDVSSAIIHIKDVTKTRLLEKRVSHSERLASLGLLISGIAHEINNPNNFISFNIPVLRDYLRTVLPITDEYRDAHPGFAPFGMSYQEFKDDLNKLLDNMEHGSDRISRTVSGLREFIRNQGAKELVWTDMQIVIDRAVMLCGSKVKNAVREFSVVVADAAAKIYTDPNALEHMLIILLINAAQAADKADSFIRVSVQRGMRWQENTIIEVSDNGCGIAADNRGKVFEPFFTTKAATGGTGLGLYICKDMINGLSGRIDVESEPGAGATVRLILPDISAP
jgi:PAS domain S-box-containing protein